MQELIPNRIVIYAKDVMNITVRKERAARKLLATIRKKYKKKGKFVSVKEFRDYTGLDLDLVTKFMI